MPDPSGSPLATPSAADVVRRLAVGELGWDDLVVADPVVAGLQALADVAVQGGLTLLVHGPAGTGKTFAMRVWAEAMRLDLWRVDCGALVARHGAATAGRGLAEVLPYGERPHAILLFHDADALTLPPAASGDVLGALVAHAGSRRAPTVLETHSPETLRAATHGAPLEEVALEPPGLDLRRRHWERLVARASPVSWPDLDRLASPELTGAQIDAAVRAVVLEHGDERLETEALLAAVRPL